MWCILPLFAPVSLVAGGPKYVAGTSFFNPGVVGKPVHWAGGQVNYYVDQGPLNSSIGNAQATAMKSWAVGMVPSRRPIRENRSLARKSRSRPPNAA